MKEPVAEEADLAHGEYVVTLAVTLGLACWLVRVMEVFIVCKQQEQIK